jgi:Kyakuja-Dileera-Zisupton transposase
MKLVVEMARPSEARAGTMALPDDTLDDCEKTFIAAQSHIAKTNNAIFADTALMALLCRHDRPLFLVNMTSAGERQYYALALIKALYKHLPDDWVVGLLYDVACQLERSMRKVCLSFAPVILVLN